MHEPQALTAFAALSQETRLRIVRLLVVGSSRMSFHLSHLEHARLVVSRRKGRSIIYSAAYPVLSGLIAFLMRDCCQGHPEVCNPAVALLSACCESENGVAHA